MFSSKGTFLEADVKEEINFTNFVMQEMEFYRLKPANALKFAALYSRHEKNIKKMEQNVLEPPDPNIQPKPAPKGKGGK